MKTNKRELKEFTVEVSGSGIIYLQAQNEDDALARARRLTPKEMCDAIDQIEIMEVQEVEDHD